ncbi:transporter substrate-binding domain-containing protein [Desemzia sp. FAM 23991]|uniref:transporter substrate-binding domain-containing protein n=1 Tax=unclassified Desemzia TaxID=2685243 RepID=UPI003887B484
MFKKLTGLAIMSTALVLAACGNEDTGNESPADGSATTVTVAVENASNPLSFTNESGELDGYEVELINMLDEAIDSYEFNTESVDAEAAQVGVDTGKYAFIGGGLFKNPEREEMYLFPDEYTGVSIIRIYTRADDDSIQTLDDLVGKTVHPVTPNGGIFNLLTDYNEAHPEAQIDIQLGESGNFAQRFQALNDGVSDAVVMPSNLGAEEIITELNLNVSHVEEPVQVNPTYLMMAQDQAELKTELDKAISELRENGELAALSEKWYGEDMFQYEITE